MYFTGGFPQVTQFFNGQDIFGLNEILLKSLVFCPAALPVRNQIVFSCAMFSHPFNLCRAFFRICGQLQVIIMPLLCYCIYRLLCCCVIDKACSLLDLDNIQLCMLYRSGQTFVIYPDCVSSYSTAISVTGTERSLSAYTR